MSKNHYYSVAIIGGGISATSLLFTLSRYTNLQNLALFEKYKDIATLNSNAKGNSQTIHCGDIETNYTLKKAAKVKKTASMLENYAKLYNYDDKYMFKIPKMALGVGEKEVKYIKKRYKEFKELYPYMELWDKEKLKEIEPFIVEGRGDEDIIAMGTCDKYSAMNFGEISKTFVKNAQKEGKNVDLFLGESIDNIEQVGVKFKLTSNKATYFADYVVVNAGAHSLLLAHKMGYGEEYSCLPIGGSFYYCNKDVLKSKVYTVQNPKLPFAAIHGDPDIAVNNKVRFGPTALALPNLERYHGSHFKEFLESLNPSKEIFEVFYDLMADEDIRAYVVKNFMFELPGVRRKLFVEDIKKIIPSIKTDDIEYARNVGGLRPQVIDKVNKQLLLGEAKIDTGKGIVFNMTPSPGATSCLGNALTDTKLICKYLKAEFYKTKFNKEIAK